MTTYTHEETMYLYHTSKCGLSANDTATIMGFDSKKAFRFRHNLFDKIKKSGLKLDELNRFIDGQKQILMTWNNTNKR